MGRTAFMLLMVLGMFLPLGCKDIVQEFSGIHGRVAWGPVEGAVVLAFDSSLYVSPAATNGLLGTARTDSRGSFSVAIPDHSIGRTIILVATFPADDPLTAVDERAKHTDFSGTVLRLEPENGPWFSMLDTFDGLSVTASITPFSTIAYHSLSSLPDDEVGAGNTRYTLSNARQCNTSLSRGLGLANDLARVLPAQAPFAGLAPFVAGYHDTSGDSTALLYTLVQLERAATSFAADTVAAGDGPLDFLAALCDDAKDGVLDGMLNGAPVPYFVLAGAPDVLGAEADGSSKVVRFIEAEGLLTAGEEAVMGPFPSIADIRAVQQASTGACRTVRVSNLNTRLVPRTGGLDVEVTGSGFSRGFSVLLASDATGHIQPSGHPFFIDAASPGGASGSIVSVSATRAVFRFPDLSAAGVPAGFGLSGTQTSAPMALWLQFDIDGPQRGALPIRRYAGTLRQFVADGLHLLDARVVRLGAGLTQTEVSAGVCAYAPLTDPEGLDPALDDVYALKLLVYNGTSTGTGDITLSQPDTVMQDSAGNNLAHALFGAGAGVIVWPSAADLAAGALTLPAATAGELLIRFAGDDTLIGGGGSIGNDEVLRIAPVLTGTNGGAPVFTGQNAQAPNPTVAFALRAAATKPAVSSGAFTSPATVTAGEDIELEWMVNAAGRGGAPFRAALLTSLDVTIAPAGETASSMNLTNNPRDFPLTGHSLSIRGLSLTSSFATGGLPFELLDSATPLTLTLGTLEGYAGAVSVTLTLAWQEPATGASGAITANRVFNVVP